MTKIALGKSGKYAIIDNEDYEMVSRYSWHLHNGGYASGYIKGEDKKQLMHRFIMNTPIAKDTDHVNGDKLDNRKSNLRVVSHAVNAANSKLSSANKSGYRCVHWDNTHKKWVAKFRYKGTRILVGYFNDQIEAANAYNQAAFKMWGEFAHLNEVNHG